MSYTGQERHKSQAVSGKSVSCELTNSSMTLSYAPPTQGQLLEALTKLERHLQERVRSTADGEAVSEVVEAVA